MPLFAGGPLNGHIIPVQRHQKRIIATVTVIPEGMAPRSVQFAYQREILPEDKRAASPEDRNRQAAFRFTEEVIDLDAARDALAHAGAGR